MNNADRDAIILIIEQAYIQGIHGNQMGDLNFL